MLTLPPLLRKKYKYLYNKENISIYTKKKTYVCNHPIGLTKLDFFTKLVSQVLLNKYCARVSTFPVHCC